MTISYPTADAEVSVVNYSRGSTEAAASPGADSSRVLTLYGNPGVTYDLLTTTNLADRSSWSSVESISLTDLFQVIDFGGATNQMQFFKAVQP